MADCRRCELLERAIHRLVGILRHAIPLYDDNKVVANVFARKLGRDAIQQAADAIAYERSA